MLQDGIETDIAELAALLDQAADGFFDVGEYGRLDGHGYPYSTELHVDPIITGGSNVYPAEVETALNSDAKVTYLLSLRA